MYQAHRRLESWRGLTGTARRILRLAGVIIFPFALCALFSPSTFADSPQDLKQELDLLREQNRVLQEQVKSQQQTLDLVNQRMSDLERKLNDSR